MPYIVELEPGTQYLAPWEGDPGRTCCIQTARIFDTERGAKSARNRARRLFNRSYPEAKVVRVYLAISPDLATTERERIIQIVLNDGRDFSLYPESVLREVLEPKQ